MELTGVLELVLSVGGFGITIWQLLKTKAAAEAARISALEAVSAIRHLNAVSTLQDIAGRTRNLLELIRAKKLPAAAAAAFELRDAVSRLPNPTTLPGATDAIPWADVSLEVDALHERLESMAIINRWATDERETLIHRTARLHTQMASGAVHIATAIGK